MMAAESPPGKVIHDPHRGSISLAAQVKMSEKLCLTDTEDEKAKSLRHKRLILR